VGDRRSAFRRWSFLALLLLPGCARGPWATPPTSLVLITFDTTRADHLGCYGYRQATSPVLDTLAMEGTVFEEAFAPAVNTNPSHASLFTGLSPAHHGNRLNANLLDPRRETLATILRRSGFRTGAFVSGYTMLASKTGFQRGFEVYEDGFSGEKRTATTTVAKAVGWLRGIPRAKPYFLFVHLYDPHGKYDPPAGIADRFRVGSYPPIPTVDRIPRHQRLSLPGGAVSLDPLDYISHYDGTISYADSQIGRILKEVGPSPLVVFAADHGETLIEREYLFAHGTLLNDEQVRVPLIFRFPEGRFRGRRVKGVAELVDILPTALATLGLPVPSGLDGRNLLPDLRKGGALPERVVISEGRGLPNIIGTGRLKLAPRAFTFSARAEGYKLILYSTTPQPTVELFNLARDPGEIDNLAVREPERVASLKRWLDLYQAEGTPAEAPELDEETKEKLRSLGYVN